MKVIPETCYACLIRCLRFFIELDTVQMYFQRIKICIKLERGYINSTIHALMIKYGLMEK
jgi:hypothetical protein